ncbi:MAG: histidine--tRNA ligase [Chlamydiota bacterium]
MEYTIPKGVFDVLPEETAEEDKWRNSNHWQYIESIIRETAHEYGFKEIRTPIFEKTDLFIRSVGETSDIVSKEMYTFLDKGERSMTLRPEGTAPVMRSFIEKKLFNQIGPHKYYYIGPMFRYERPQAGRYRQHHQFGAEAIGNTKPEQDVEMIDLLCTIYQRLGLKNLTVMLNSVGDTASRESYKAALTEYLRPKFEQLSPDSQIRFSKNILRILDSKNPQDQKMLMEAPTILDFLSDESSLHLQKVRALLDQIQIPYVINSKLVRGLDYYNKTVFEITSGELGAQNSVGAGGRYDGLISSLGGPNLPAVGFGTGLERLLQTMTKQHVYFPPQPHPRVFLIPLGEKAETVCFKWLHDLRKEKIAAEIDFHSKKIANSFQLAAATKSDYALVIGDQELDIMQAKLKNMNTREETAINLSDLINILKNLGNN